MGRVDLVRRVTPAGRLLGSTPLHVRSPLMLVGRATVEAIYLILIYINRAILLSCLSLLKLRRRVPYGWKPLLPINSINIRIASMALRIQQVGCALHVTPASEEARHVCAVGLLGLPDRMLQVRNLILQLVRLHG